MCPTTVCTAWRPDGSDDKLIYSADSLDLYGFYMLGSDKLLVLQNLDYEAENAIAMTMPDWDVQQRRFSDLYGSFCEP